jgi:flagellar assembly protein FliH
MDAEQNNEFVNVDSYRPAEYVAERWPVLEEKASDNTFAPAQFEVVSRSSFVADPMFANFEETATASSDPSEPPEPFFPEVAHSITPQSGDVQNSFRHEASPQEDSFVESGAPDLETLEPVAAKEELEPSENIAAEQETQDSGEMLREALEAARAEGYTQGCADTQAQVEEMRGALQERAVALLEDIQTQSQEILRQYESKAIDLALQVSKRLMGDVVETQRDYIVAVIRDAMQAAAGAQIRKIRVSSQDREWLTKPEAAEQIRLSEGSTIVLEADETIKAGCVIETVAGEVDFDLDAAWNRLRSKILQGPQS